MKPIDTEAVLRELHRELAMRRNLYPKWIADSKLTSQTAERRIAALEDAIWLISNPLTAELFEPFDE